MINDFSQSRTSLIVDLLRELRLGAAQLSDAAWQARMAELCDAGRGPTTRRGRKTPAVDGGIRAKPPCSVQLLISRGMPDPLHAARGSVEQSCARQGCKAEEAERNYGGAVRASAAFPETLQVSKKGHTHSSRTAFLRLPPSSPRRCVKGLRPILL